MAKTSLPLTHGSVTQSRPGAGSLLGKQPGSSPCLRTALSWMRSCPGAPRVPPAVKPSSRSQPHPGTRRRPPPCLLPCRQLRATRPALLAGRVPPALPTTTGTPGRSPCSLHDAHQASRHLPPPPCALLNPSDRQRGHGKAPGPFAALSFGLFQPTGALLSACPKCFCRTTELFKPWYPRRSLSWGWDASSPQVRHLSAHLPCRGRGQPKMFGLSLPPPSKAAGAAEPAFKPCD